MILLIFCYSWYKERINYILLIAASPFFLFSFIYSKIALPLLYIWMFFGKILSEITSTVILAIIFFVGIFPLKLFLKRDKTTAGWINAKENTDFNEQF